MATTHPLRKVDVATGVISGSLAAAFFTLAAIAALPANPTVSVNLVDPAVAAALATR